MKKEYSLFKNFLGRDWYIQGFSAVPIFLSTAAISGTYMKKYLGYGYKHFLFCYRDGYGEMAYDPKDFKRIWRKVRKELASDPEYLKRIKKLFLKNLRRYRPFLKKIKEENLNRMSDREIIFLLKKLIRAQVDYVGVSHIIDAIGVEIEKEFKKKLTQEMPGADRSEFNRIFSKLITPSRISFVNSEENELLAIKGGLKNKKALEQHALKYHWIGNSYAGPKLLKISDFQAKLKNLLKDGHRQTKEKEKKDRYYFTEELCRLVAIIDYCAVWQDERKALLFKNISYAGLVLNEIASRLKEKTETFYYLGLSEIESLKDLGSLGRKIPLLRERRQGCLILIRGLKDSILCGRDYLKLMKNRKGLPLEKEHDSRELHGTVANTGTAQGTVRIIRNIESLKKFKTGNILVASMTRPEYMPAIKKAAAIVTDEGGITCHAAIIARELDIPAIIGTKSATRILHDGDIVEVRANHGIVRIVD